MRPHPLAIAAAAVSVVVATPTAADAPAGRYTVRNMTVSDTKTRLTWQQFSPASEYTWGNAKIYCANLSLDGFGWRLPTVKELITLVDVSKQAAASIDSATFLSVQAHYFWSATPLAGEPKNSWLVNFAGGASYAFGDVTLGYDVRCVR